MASFICRCGAASTIPVRGGSCSSMRRATSRAPMRTRRSSPKRKRSSASALASRRRSASRRKVRPRRPRSRTRSDRQGRAGFRCVARAARSIRQGRRGGAARGDRGGWTACLAAPRIRRSGSLGHADRRHHAARRAHLRGQIPRARDRRAHPRDLRCRDGRADRSRNHQRAELKPMPINILMPALSPTMEKGNLAKWLKKEGEKVKPGDVIAEIETDKATMEVEAVDEGTLAKSVVPEGTADVPVNQLIAVLAAEGEDAKAAAGAAASAPAPKAAEAPKAAAPPAPPKAETPPPNPPAPAPTPAPSATGPATNGHGRIFSSPLARRLAREAGIDLARIARTGPHGPVGARDIAAAKEGKGLKAPAAAPAGAAAPAIQLPSDDKIRALYEDGSYEIVPHDNMRRIIAQRLTASVQTIPHFYLTIDCVIDTLIAAREEINASAPKNK